MASALTDLHKFSNAKIIYNMKNSDNQNRGIAKVDFTEREITILKLMSQEKSTKEIGDEMELSPRTVEAMRDKIKTKTGLTTLIGIVLYAVKHNFIPMP